MLKRQFSEEKIIELTATLEKNLQGYEKILSKQKYLASDVSFSLIQEKFIEQDAYRCALTD